jgi:hypothetical protein
MIWTRGGGSLSFLIDIYVSSRSLLEILAASPEVHSWHHDPMQAAMGVELLPYQHPCPKGNLGKYCGADFPRRAKSFFGHLVHISKMHGSHIGASA